MNSLRKDESYSLSSWIFLRWLGLIYFAAFLSLFFQVPGLFGSKGISPIQEFLRSAFGFLGSEAYFRFPGLFWISASDTTLVFISALGVLASLAVLFRFFEGWSLLICYLCYLSFSTSGQDFLSFQWDSLLLEAGFISLFAASFRRSAEHKEPDRFVRWLFLLLLFKLIFLSGVVKLQSGDPSWRDLTALTYHYWTQPIPNSIAPFLHAAPVFFHRICTGLVLVVELVFPFLIFFPRFRYLAAISFVALSLLILSTGNYAFFNWLTISLTFWLLPNSFWLRFFSRLSKILPRPEQGVAQTNLIKNQSRKIIWLTLPIYFLTLFWSTRWFLPASVTDLVMPIAQWGVHFRVSQPYGLFATMTKARGEISIEGSADGSEWKAYEFKFKPDSLLKSPPFVAPHQPRLDWQMWFAALGRYEDSPWLQNLLVRLLQGSDEVEALFAHNPFEDKPPKFIRTSLALYRFAEPNEIISTGVWWNRQELGQFGPTLSAQ